MHMIDIITKKRDGFELTKQEIEFFILLTHIQKVKYLIIK